MQGEPWRKVDGYSMDGGAFRRGALLLGLRCLEIMGIASFSFVCSARIGIGSWVELGRWGVGIFKRWRCFFFGRERWVRGWS
jgi:hypothetical protein